MQRRDILLAASALIATRALPAMAEPLSLGQLSQYFNNLTTARARFTQFNSDGTKSNGTFLLNRPGRMRFEYDPPEETLVLAGGGVVAIFDAKSNAEPQQFPLRRTPLNVILKRRVNLASTNMVTGHRETESGQTAITARDPENPGTGSLELIFDPRPIALRQWVVTDETGNRTAVLLGELETGLSFPARLFSAIQESKRRRR